MNESTLKKGAELLEQIEDIGDEIGKIDKIKNGTGLYCEVGADSPKRSGPLTITFDEKFTPEILKLLDHQRRVLMVERDKLQTEFKNLSDE